MQLEDFKKLNLPDGPGVYFFKKTAQRPSQRPSDSGQKLGIQSESEIQLESETLYIGKATSLRDRVRSYFNDDLIHTRGRLLVDMVVQADTITYQETDSVLEAFILESELIKKYLPRYNTKEKDNKSFNYVVMTREDFPRVLVVRGRNLEKAGTTKQEQIESLGFEYTDVFGPFPFGAELREAMKLIRRIFPYRDKCVPQNGKPCFNRSIGLCPGVCTGEILKEEYAVQISHIRNFFRGKKQLVVEELKKEMFALAKEQKFEEANEVKKTLGALAHIRDISMIKKDAEFGYTGKRGGTSRNGEGVTNFNVRAEAYDIAHMSGKDMVGVMVVMHDGDFVKDQYKKFNIREIKASNDTGALKQVLERRFKHVGASDESLHWPLPTHIVLDGGVAQLHVAEQVLKSFNLKDICLVAVTKDKSHKAKEIIRSTLFNTVAAKAQDSIFDDGDIISLNQECHRFAIATHRKRRSLSRGL